MVSPLRVANATGGGVASAPLLSSHETDVIGFAPVPSQHWVVMVAEDPAIFTADVSDLSRTQFFNAFVLALIIGGLVIFVGRAFDTTERESLSDPLTGLANRRFLQEILLRELPARPAGQPACCPDDRGYRPLQIGQRHLTATMPATRCWSSWPGS